jgi:WD40 repeat protein
MLFRNSSILFLLAAGAAASFAADKPDSAKPAAKLDRPQIVAQVGHNTRVGALAISPDGTLVATVGTDGRVFLWDSATGRQLRELTIPDSGETSFEPKPPKGVGFSPDSAFVSANGNIWNALSGEFIGDGQEGEFTRDSKGIISKGSQLNWVKKEVPAGKAHQKQPMPATDADAVPIPPKAPSELPAASKAGPPAVSNDGSLAATKDDAPKAEPTEFKYEFESVRAFCPIATCFAQSADGKWMAFGREDGWIYIADSNSAERLMRLRLLDSGKLEAFDAIQSKDVQTKTKESGLGALFHAFSGKPKPPDPDEARWKAQEEEKPDNLEPIGSIAISNDGKRLVVGGKYGSLACSNVDDWSPLWSQSLRDPINSLKWSPDDKLLKVQTEHQILLLEPKAGAQDHQYDCDRSTLCGFLSSDGRIAVTGHADRAVRLWDANQGKLTRRFIGAYGAVQAVVLSSDGKLVSAYDALGVFSQWNVADAKLLRQTLVRPPAENDAPLPFIPAPAPPAGGGRPQPAPPAKGPPFSTPDSAKNISSPAVPPFPQGASRPIFQLAAAEGEAKRNDTAALKPSEVFAGFNNETKHNSSFEHFGIFSSNGRSLVIDRTVFDVASGKRAVQPPTQQGNDRYEVCAVANDGSFAVVAKGSGNFSYDIAILNLRTLKIVRKIGSGSFDSPVVAISRDNAWVAYDNNWGEFQVVAVANGKVARKAISAFGSASCLAFTPDGGKLACGGPDGHIKLTNRDTGKLVREFIGHGAAVTDLNFSADGRTMLSCSLDEKPRLWNVETGQTLRVLDDAEMPSVADVAFTSDGGIVEARRDGHIVVRDQTGDKIRNTQSVAENDEIVDAVCFRPDGATAVVSLLPGNCAYIKSKSTGSSSDSIVQEKLLLPGPRIVLVDLRAPKPPTVLQDLRHSRTAFGQSAVFVGSPPQIYSYTLSGALRSWGASGVVEKRQLEGETGALGAEFLDCVDHRHLIAVDESETHCRVWSLPSGKLLRNIPSAANPVAFSPDDRLALVQIDVEDRELSLIDLSTGKTVRRIPGAVCGAFWPTGGWLLTGQDDMSLRLWNLQAGGKEARRIQVEALPPRLKGQKGVEQVIEHQFDRIQLSASGRLVFTVDIGRNKVFDTTTTKLVCELETPKEQPGLFDFFSTPSDEEKKANANRFDDGTFWHRLNAVAFTPDELSIVGREENPGRRIVVWNAKTGKLTRIIVPPVDGEIDLSPDGKFILQSGHDDILYLWSVSTGELLCQLVLLDDDHWAVIDPAGRFDASNGGDVAGLHWVVRNEPIDLAQLKERYYEPGLLAKKLGISKEPLRDVQSFSNPKLAPVVSVHQPKSGQTKFEIELANRGGGIGNIVVLVNGKKYDLPESRGGKPDVSAAHFSLPIDLAGDPRLIPGGKNKVEVQAYNAEGYLRSRGVELEIDDPRPKNTNPTNVWALVAGTTHYQGGKIDLSFPAKDAADFATGLEVAGGRLFGPENVHVALLTSPRTDVEPQPDAMHRPTRANLTKALEALSDPQKVKPGDVVIVYLAGHGVARGGSEDSFYYLTCDAQSAQLDDSELRQQWTISDRELTQWLKSSPAQKQVMILDTCQSGKVVEDLMAKREISSSQERALERVKDSTGFYILAGCAADKASYEASRYGQGVLTYALLFGMRGAALKDEQFVDVGRLFDFAKTEVPHLAGEIGGVQQPVIASPKGSTFVIGQITKDDLAKIPLQVARPLVLRTSFHDEQELDPLDLSGQLDELLRDVSAATRGERTPLAFVDARRSPGAYRLAGSYQVKGEQVNVNVRFVAPDGTAAQFTVAGEKSKVADLATKICDAVQTRLATPKAK